MEQDLRIHLGYMDAYLNNIGGLEYTKDNQKMANDLIKKYCAERDGLKGRINSELIVQMDIQMHEAMGEWNKMPVSLGGRYR